MEKLKKTIATFSLGFNFSDDLVEGLVRLNKINDRRKISEVFGALPDSPLNSARPLNRIPEIDWSKFRNQVEILSNSNIQFNYLFNTQQQLTDDIRAKLSFFLDDLLRIGVCHLTIGTIEVANFIRDIFPNAFHQTLSLTYGVKSLNQLDKIKNNLFDALYLDGSFINRNFKKIKQFVNYSKYEIRLYANLSCIANCPVIRQHYSLFSNPFNENTIKDNDNYFKSCSLVKLSNPTEYIQMPWIRPEDIKAYMEEGVMHFKLSDRLSSTDVLLKIAKAYLSETSTDNLFDIIERNGDKYKYFNLTENANNLIRINNSKIPNDFIDHFRFGNCTSTDFKCTYCETIANTAVSMENINIKGLIEINKESINSKLLSRIKR